MDGRENIQELSGRAYPQTEMMNFQKFYHMLLQSRKTNFGLQNTNQTTKKSAKWNFPAVWILPKFCRSGILL